MSTTAKQDNAFLVDVIGTGTLEAAIEWIQSNLSPAEVFTISDLSDWAEDNLDKVADKHLIEWAESNGYIKE